MKIWVYPLHRIPEGLVCLVSFNVIIIINVVIMIIISKARNTKHGDERAWTASKNRQWSYQEIEVRQRGRRRHGDNHRQPQQAEVMSGKKSAIAGLLNGKKLSHKKHLPSTPRRDAAFFAFERSRPRSFMSYRFLHTRRMVDKNYFHEIEVILNSHHRFRPLQPIHSREAQLGHAVYNKTLHLRS